MEIRELSSLVESSTCAEYRRTVDKKMKPFLSVRLLGRCVKIGPPKPIRG